MTRSLWRLDGATAATLVQPARLEQGLRLHIAHTALTTVLMQIGDQQQAYIGVGGCDGCAHGRCMPGCYVELLKRLVRVCFDACTLRPVAGGLAKRPYRRAALVWPTAKAEPLAGLSLAAWAGDGLAVLDSAEGAGAKACEQCIPAATPVCTRLATRTRSAVA